MAAFVVESLEGYTGALTNLYGFPGGGGFPDLLLRS